LISDRRTNWLVLILIVFVGALIRHTMITEEVAAGPRGELSRRAHVHDRAEED
jgi:uncharacterized membrane protein